MTTQDLQLIRKYLEFIKTSLETFKIDADYKTLNNLIDRVEQEILKS